MIMMIKKKKKIIESGKLHNLQSIYLRNILSKDQIEKFDSSLYQPNIFIT